MYTCMFKQVLNCYTKSSAPDFLNYGNGNGTHLHFPNGFLHYTMCVMGVTDQFPKIPCISLITNSYLIHKL